MYKTKLFITDLHDDLAAWAWAAEEVRSGRHDALLYGGDAFNEFSGRPLLQQLADRQKFFAECPIDVYACTGNHDWSPGVVDIGEGYWLHRLMEKHKHVHTGGTFVLPGEYPFVITCVDYLEPLIFSGEAVGPGTIIMQHVPPSGRCSWQDGQTDWGDDHFADGLNQNYSAPALILGGHVHNPASFATRQGRMKTLVLNPGVCSPGRPNHWILDTMNESVRFVSGDGKHQDVVLPIYTDHIELS